MVRDGMGKECVAKYTQLKLATFQFGEIQDFIYNNEEVLADIQ
jgi:hypothetical protein